MVAIEDLEKRGLGSGGAFDAAETDIIAGTGKIAQVKEEILEPEAGTLANGSELRGLVVGVAEGGEIFLFESELGELVNNGCEFGKDNVEALTEKDEVGIVGAVTGGS